jgi:inosose dehydratase
MCGKAMFMRKISRRAFIGGAAGAAAGPLFSGTIRSGKGRTRPGRREGKPVVSPPPARRFELGLASYTFREFDLDSTLAMAGRLGLVRIALKDVHLPLDSPEAAVRAAAAKVKAAGLALYGCGVVYMKNEAEVDRAFTYARTGSMDVIIGVPGHELLARVERRVRETGIRLAIHNHGPGDLLYPTPRTILDRVRSLDPRVGVCLDIGHCQRSGIDPSEAAAECGPRLLDVHLKDVTASTKDGTATGAGRGVVDLVRFLRTLTAMAYGGTAAFEYEKDGKDPLPGLAESVGYVRGILAAEDRGRGA